MHQYKTFSSVIYQFKCLIIFYPCKKDNFIKVCSNSTQTYKNIYINAQIGIPASSKANLLGYDVSAKRLTIEVISMKFEVSILQSRWSRLWWRTTFKHSLLRFQRDEFRKFKRKHKRFRCFQFDILRSNNSHNFFHLAVQAQKQRLLALHFYIYEHRHNRKWKFDWWSLYSSQMDTMKYLNFTFYLNPINISKTWDFLSLSLSLSHTHIYIYI